MQRLGADLHGPDNREDLGDDPEVEEEDEEEDEVLVLLFAVAT